MTASRRSDKGGDPEKNPPAAAEGATPPPLEQSAGGKVCAMRSARCSACVRSIRARVAPLHNATGQQGNCGALERLRSRNAGSTPASITGVASSRCQGVGKGKRVRLAPSEDDLAAAAATAAAGAPGPAPADVPVPMAVDPGTGPSTSGRTGPIPLADVKLPLELNTRVRPWRRPRDLLPLR